MAHNTTEYDVIGHDVFTSTTLADADIRILSQDGDMYKLAVDGVVYMALVKHFDIETKTSTINVSGYDFTVKINEPLDQMVKDLGFLTAAKQSVKDIKSPMPGLVVTVFVKVGDQVIEGEKLLSLEAMKMENILKSPSAGIIQSIHVASGNSVEKNQILIQFE